MTDVAPFSLGVAAATRFGARQVQGMFAPIIDRGTVIPVSRAETFHTVGDNQTQIGHRRCTRTAHRAHG